MEENKDSYPQADYKKPNIKESPNEQIRFLTMTIDTLSNELKTIKESVLKRRSENTTLRVLFYTGLFVLLVGFLYSNSVLQRAHMRSLEKNILSLEERLSRDIGQILTNLELDIQNIQKQLETVDGADIFTILGRMDYAISQVHPKKEKTVMLINQVRLNTDKLSQLLKDQARSSQPK